VSNQPPAPQPDWAWFFDIDGTLAAIASSPDMVQIDPVMQGLIADLHRQSLGAVALISGRAIRDIDRLFPELQLAVAGQHGAEHRSATGAVTWQSAPNENLAAMRDRLQQIARPYPGLLLEDKGLSLALHYRMAPELTEFVYDQMHAIFAQFGTGFHLQEGKCVLEVVPLSINKGGALREFMREPPFQNRVPVFVGDDVTDENAFTMVNELGGVSVKVGAGKTSAHYCLADVSAVRQWLSSSRPSQHIANQISAGGAL
jgi:trehalose 6-phosphate phosphatase